MGKSQSKRMERRRMRHANPHKINGVSKVSYGRNGKIRKFAKDSLAANEE